MELAKSLIMHLNKKSPIAEMYRMLRTNIINSKVCDKVKTIVVTSSITGEGKSTTATNLAIAFAQIGHKTLLIDADMRKPSLHQFFGVSRSIGLTNILKNPSVLASAIIPITECGIDLIPAGQVTYDPTGILSSKILPALFEKLQEVYDIIIVDTPPVRIITDATLFSKVADGYVFVVAEEAATKNEVTKAKQNLENIGAPILGAVFNKMASSLGKGSYYYRYYYDLYSYGQHTNKNRKKKKSSSISTKKHGNTTTNK